MWEICQDDPEVCAYLETVLCLALDPDNATLSHKEVQLTTSALVGESALMNSAADEEETLGTDGHKLSGISAKVRCIDRRAIYVWRVLYS